MAIFSDGSEAAWTDDAAHRRHERLIDEIFEHLNRGLAGMRRDAPPDEQLRRKGEIVREVLPMVDQARRLRAVFLVPKR